jgi:hypothetical protein
MAPTHTATISSGIPAPCEAHQTHNCATNSEHCELRFCWIKADPTFEGLKQILYEPDERVVIQPTDPAPVKSSQCITEFDIANSILDPELAFAETKLFLSEGLVAVTGGKGSGKTALVDLIANMYESRGSCDDKNSFVRRVSEADEPEDLNTALTLLSGERYPKEVKDNIFIEDASIVYVAQGELDRHVEDPAHLEAYINSLIFESNGIKDTELVFDYGNIGDEIETLRESLQKSNAGIVAIEFETDPRIEDGVRKDGKKHTTDLLDTQKKIEELAKGLNQEKIAEAEAKQKQLAELRERKTNLNDLGVTVRDALKFLDEGVPSFNTQITKIDELAQHFKLGGAFPAIQYERKKELRGLIDKVREELRQTIVEIEKFQ